MKRWMGEYTDGEQIIDKWVGDRWQTEDRWMGKWVSE